MPKFQCWDKTEEIASKVTAENSAMAARIFAEEQWYATKGDFDEMRVRVRDEAETVRVFDAHVEEVDVDFYMCKVSAEEVERDKKREEHSARIAQMKARVETSKDSNEETNHLRTRIADLLALATSLVEEAIELRRNEADVADSDRESAHEFSGQAKAKRDAAVRIRGIASECVGCIEAANCGGSWSGHTCGEPNVVITVSGPPLEVPAQEGLEAERDAMKSRMA